MGHGRCGESVAEVFEKLVPYDLRIELHDAKLQKHCKFVVGVEAVSAAGVHLGQLDAAIVFVEA